MREIFRVHPFCPFVDPATTKQIHKNEDNEEQKQKKHKPSSEPPSEFQQATALFVANMYHGLMRLYHRLIFSGTLPPIEQVSLVISLNLHLLIISQIGGFF